LSIINTQRPSLKLKLMLEEVNQAFGHAKEAVLSAYTQAKLEGFSPKGAKDLILNSVKFKKSTVYLYLPDEAKDKKMQALAKRPASLQTWNANRIILLEDKISELIHDQVDLNRQKGLPSQFILSHDQKRVVSVEDISEKQNQITGSQKEST
jgi:hypothetical protein